MADMAPKVQIGAPLVSVYHFYVCFSCRARVNTIRSE